MRALSDEMLATFEESQLSPVVFYDGEFLTGSLRLWSGIGTISWDGKDWTGAGSLLSIAGIEETSQLRAVGINVSLSGMPTEIIAAVLEQARFGRSGKLWLGAVDDNDGRLYFGIAEAGSINTLTIPRGSESIFTTWDEGLVGDEIATDWDDGATTWDTLSIATAPIASAVDDAYVGQRLRIIAGAGSTQERVVSDYVAATRVVTVSPRWRTNLLKWSDDLTKIATWQDLGSPDIVVFNNGISDLGLPWNQIQDSHAGAYDGKFQDITVANDSSTYVFSCYVAKTTGGTSPTFGINLSFTGGTPVSVFPRLNTDTGASSGSIMVEDVSSDAWRISKTFSNNSTGNTTLRVSVQPAVAPYGIGADSATVIGIADATGFQIEKYGSLGDYIRSSSAPVIIPNSTSDTGTYGALVADPYLIFKGKMDQPQIEETGETCMISTNYESRLIDLERSNVRRWTNDDQQIEFPGDSGFRYVALLPDRSITWGGVTIPPSRGGPQPATQSVPAAPAPTLGGAGGNPGYPAPGVGANQPIGGYTQARPPMGGN